MATPIEVGLQIIQVIVVPLIGYGAYKLRDIDTKLQAIKDDLRKINGRVGRLEEWTKGHEQLDQERHQAMQRELDAIWHRQKGTQGP